MAVCGATESVSSNTNATLERKIGMIWINVYTQWGTLCTELVRTFGNAFTHTASAAALLRTKHKAHSCTIR